MQKTYEGWNSRNPTKQRVIVDWLCPHCRSGNVVMIEDEHYKNARWCDGDVTTHDQFGKWNCKSCGKSERGSRMIQIEISRTPINEPEKVEKSLFGRIINRPKDTQ